MFRIKKLDIFTAKQFGLLFAGTFFICQFVLMMQFLWRWVDDLIGKGLSMEILAQFFWHMETLPCSSSLTACRVIILTHHLWKLRREQRIDSHQIVGHLDVQNFSATHLSYYLYQFQFLLLSELCRS